MKGCNNKMKERRESQSLGFAAFYLLYMIVSPLGKAEKSSQI
jgi:hypothetical protein